MKAWYRLLLRGVRISPRSHPSFLYTAWSTDSFGATKPVRFFFMVTSEMLLMSSLDEGQHDSGIAEGNQCTWFHIFRKAKALFRLGTVSDGDPAGLQFQFRQFHDGSSPI